MAKQASQRERLFHVAWSFHTAIVLFSLVNVDIKTMDDIVCSDYFFKCDHLKEIRIVLVIEVPK